MNHIKKCNQDKFQISLACIAALSSFSLTASAADLYLFEHEEKVCKDVDLQTLFEQHYANEDFVDVLPAGSHPETRSVKGSNYCRIALHQQPDSNVIIVLSVIDNLVKGASGQAVQNMNLMFGLDERAGINQVPLMP